MELNFWTPLDTINANTKVKGQSSRYVVIIDCTEIEIQKPKSPLEQQQTWSSYKNCNTVKALVGTNATRVVVYVSDVYGGSISDRALVEKCGILDLLKPEDIVLADRGFQIQDLLASRDVSIVIPDFVKMGGWAIRTSTTSF